jgi:signal transduction histidine kinase
MCSASAAPPSLIVQYMERSCKIIEMERSEQQRKELSLLCEEWSSSSGMVLPPLLTSSAFVSMAIKDDPRIVKRRCCGSCFDRDMGCMACGGIGQSLRETRAISKAFGSMLYSLASYDELEAINHAKRQFIRYIFHEVRVPFNAIVLGIEQMEMELREYSTMLPGSLDTLSIIAEQSQVVSRILNDVLSMQKVRRTHPHTQYAILLKRRVSCM